MQSILLQAYRPLSESIPMEDHTIEMCIRDRDYRMKSATMNKNQKLSVKMARNGGFAAVLE